MELTTTGSSSAPTTSGLYGTSASPIVAQPGRDPHSTHQPTACREQTLLDFSLWLARQLGMPARIVGPQLEIGLPEEDRELFGGREVLTVQVVRGRLLTCPAPGGGDGEHPQQVEPMVWLLDRLASRGPAAHARPTEQPMAVYAIASRLFAAYQVDGGQAHLAGCQLEDRPFLRLSYPLEASKGAVQHLYVGPDGSSVSEELVAELGLDRIDPVATAAPRLPVEELQALIAAGQRMAAQQKSRRDPAASAGKPLATAIVWAKYAHGTLQFSIGEHSATLPFGGWASTLAPPPFVCAHTRVSTFRLAATDDGRIVAADQTAACEHSGQRVLGAELVTCRATSRRVLQRFTTMCPVLGEPVLSDQFDECRVCGEQVSRPALQRGACNACRNLRPLAEDDPRLAWLIGEHPALANWRWWRLSETATCYIVRAAGYLKQLLVVCDRDSLSIRRLATGRRGSSRWTAVPPDSWESLLG